MTVAVMSRRLGKVSHGLITKGNQGPSILGFCNLAAIHTLTQGSELLKIILAVLLIRV